jgi:hypothetical protein
MPLCFVTSYPPATLPCNVYLPLQHRRRPNPSLVVEVSRHRYGGRLVSLHSCVQLVNSTALPLQLGCVSGQGWEPLALEVLGPGDSVWLPLQVGGCFYCFI